LTDIAEIFISKFFQYISIHPTFASVLLSTFVFLSNKGKV